MSAARYTSMRRTLVTANVTKVHYPTNIAKNYDALYSAIPCNSDYTLIAYADPPCCKISTPACITYDGGSSTNNYITILDGGNSTSAFTPLDAENSTSIC